MTDQSNSPETAAGYLVEKYLVCPETHHALAVEGETISCTGCGFKGALVHDVAVMLEGNHTSFFDDKFEIMRQGLLERGAEWRIFVEPQVALVKKHFAAGQVILDVGCGPQLPYEPPESAFLIGLEPSLPSIRANNQVDLRVCGTATNIPLPDRSVDLAIAFYSVHHMVGRRVQENDRIVETAFLELGRVIKPGGILLVVEMTPWAVFAALQRLLWNPVKRLLDAKLDMYFRSAQSMAAFGRVAFPNATLETINFKCSPFAVFPPVFSLPSLRVPKLLYPLEARAYKWHLPR